VNLLSGLRDELLPEFASHRAIDGLLLAGEPDPKLGQAAADSVKRVRWASLASDEAPRRVDWIEPFVEVKTFWHPVSP